MTAADINGNQSNDADGKDTSKSKLAEISDEESQEKPEKSSEKVAAVVVREGDGLADPFQHRAGKTLSWTHVCMTVRNGPSGDKEILSDCWGQAHNETTAIMGPSGAGKTSLLNVLAGRVCSNKKVTVSAKVCLGSELVDPINVRKHIAFVPQNDTLFCSATPRESIRFSARLRLPAQVTAEQIEALTDHMLKELGLLDCADTVVGDGETMAGISGGERKRTAVGVELVTKPDLVFLDEPTSGLDSYSALQLTAVLRKVAQSGASVLFTIHQPASDIFQQFDRLILLNKGRVMYQGSVQNVPAYFGGRGRPLPPNYNPADWILIVAQSTSIKDLEEQGFFPNDERDSLHGGVTKGAASTAIVSRAGMKTQVWWLMQRDLRSLKRDKKIVGMRLMLTTFMSLVNGLIFWDVGNSDSTDIFNLQYHFGSCLMALMIAVFGGAMPTLVIFPQERPVFLREYSTNHYSVVSYFLSRLFMEALLTAGQILLLSFLTYFMMGFQMLWIWAFVILYSMAMTSTAIAMLIGAAIADPKLAVELLPMTIVPQILFSGFFIAPDLMRFWLVWLQWLMPLAYGTKLLLAEEFTSGNCEGLATCAKMLERQNIKTDDVWWYWLALLGLFLFFRLSALLVLERKARYF